MKIIKGILFSLLALGLIACTGIFILFQTFDTDKYLSLITKKAATALGRPVSIGHVGLGFSLRGITLDAGPLVVADDPDFTTQPFIKVDKVCISLDLRSLLLQGKIYVAGIFLQSPQIHFIRSEEGIINVHSIGQRSGSADKAIAVPKAKGSVLLAREDKASLLTNNRSFSLAGEGSVQPGHIDTLDIKIQDASISFLDQNRTFPLDVWLTDINANLNGFTFSKPFQLILDASLYGNAPNVHVDTMMSVGKKDFDTSFSGLRLDVDLSQVDINRFKGVSPQMSNNPLMRGVSGVIQLDMGHLDIGPSMDITADGDIGITGGLINGFNPINAVLSHAAGIFGGMSGNIDNFINSQLKDKLGGNDTVIEKARARFSLQNKTVTIEDSLIQTNVLEFSAKGSIDQGSSMDMETMLHLNSDISAALVNEFAGMKLLCDESDRIAIGASLKGVIPHLKYKPNKDFRKKSKRFFIEEGGNILGVFLGGGQITLKGQDASLQDQHKKQKKNFKNIFKSFLQ